MKNIFIFFFLLIYQECGAQEIQTKFILYAPGLSDTSSVFIVGSIHQLGNWNPAKIKMNYIGNNVWGIDIVVPQSQAVEYKYTLGSWNSEAVGSKGFPLSNFSTTLSEDKMVRDTVYYWKNIGARATSQIKGSVKYHRAFKGEGISERDVVVWLPPDYDSSSNKRYPVLYMQDGQNVFDPATSSFGTDWQIDESTDSMIRTRVIPPMIIVGIYNSVERSMEYLPTDMGKKYRDFLATQLKPFIDSAYHTMPGRRNNYVGGSSAGGILAFMMVWDYPGVFSKAICMSPAFRRPGNPDSGWNFVSTVKEDSKRKKVFFYIDNGGIGLEQQLQPGIDEMIKALINKGYRAGKDFIFVLDPAAKHSEEAWAKRFPTALKLITGRR